MASSAGHGPAVRAFGVCGSVRAPKAWQNLAPVLHAPKFSFHDRIMRPDLGARGRCRCLGDRRSIRVEAIGAGGAPTCSLAGALAFAATFAPRLDSLMLIRSSARTGLASITSRMVRPLSVMRQPPLIRPMSFCEKMSRLGTRAANLLVRSAQSRPLVARMAISRLSSAIGANPSG